MSVTDDRPESPDDPHAQRRRKAGPFSYDIEVNPVDPDAVSVGDDATGPAGEHPAIAPADEPTIRLRHNRVELALHHLRPANDESVQPLLSLHGLGERTPADVPEVLCGWPGAIWGLDLTGHGHSTIPHGGGYTAELLMADVDAALAHLGEATIAGRGLGAYVALLVAGARPALVRGAVLMDGPGIVGGGIGPGAPRITTVSSRRAGTPDPFALAELTVDVRPPDYALTYLHLAVQGSDLVEPITLCGSVRPPWMAAIEREPGVRTASISAALDAYVSPAQRAGTPPDQPG